MNHRLRPSARRHGQQGVVLLMSLIILTVLLAASVALVRSFDTTLSQAGNLAFKRDLTNQAERVMPEVLTRFTDVAGSLSTPAARGASIVADNYSARILDTNDQGIPRALLGALTAAPTDAGLGVVGAIARDRVDTGQQITVRYLVDRLCNATGLETNPAVQCSGVDLQSRGGSESSGLPIARQITYRVSVRVDGPRNTQAFFQTVFSL